MKKVNDFLPTDEENNNALYLIFEYIQKSFSEKDVNNRVKLIVFSSVMYIIGYSNLVNKILAIKKMQDENIDAVPISSNEKHLFTEMLQKNNINLQMDQEAEIFRTNGFDYKEKEYHFALGKHIRFFLRFNAKLFYYAFKNLLKQKKFCKPDARVHWIGAGRYREIEDDYLTGQLKISGMPINYLPNIITDIGVSELCSVLKLQVLTVFQFKKYTRKIEEEIGELFDIDLSHQISFFSDNKRFIKFLTVHLLPSIVYLQKMQRWQDNAIYMIRGGGNPFAYYLALYKKITDQDIRIMQMPISYNTNDRLIHLHHVFSKMLLPCEFSKIANQKNCPDYRENFINVGKPFNKQLFEKYRDLVHVGDNLQKIMLVKSNANILQNDFERMEEVIRIFETFKPDYFTYHLKLKNEYDVDYKYMTEKITALKNEGRFVVDCSRIDQAISNVDMVCVMASPDIAYITHAMYEVAISRIPFFLYLYGTHDYINYAQEYDRISFFDSHDLNHFLHSHDSFEGIIQAILRNSEEFSKLFFNNEDTLGILKELLNAELNNQE